jgi:lipopolysaccharide heptosyltransferase II
MRDWLVSGMCGLARPLFRARAFPFGLHLPLRRVLIIKPCCLGDVLFATPVAAALRRAFPLCQIDWLVHAHARQILRNNPHVDGLMDARGVMAGRVDVRAVAALVGQLRTVGYEAAFVLERSPLAGVMAWLAGIPVRVGLDSQGRGFAHSLRVAVRPHEVRHEVQVYLDVVRATGTQVHSEQPIFEFTPADLAAARACLADTPEPLVVTIHPGGGINPGMRMPSKRWPAANFAALGDRLVEDLGAKVVLVGGRGDEDAVAHVDRAMRHTPINLAGRLSLSGLAALATLSRLYVGNDTGATHIAAAAGAAVVAIFGPTDVRRYAPLGTHVTAVAPPIQAAARRLESLAWPDVEQVFEAAVAAGLRR